MIAISMFSSWFFFFSSRRRHTRSLCDWSSDVCSSDLKRTKGFFLTKSKLYQSAQEAANRADRYAFRDRRTKKREYRRLWIQRIGAAARLNGLTYGQLIHGLKAAGVTLARKLLADLAVKDAPGFVLLVEKAKVFAPKPTGRKAK